MSPYREGERITVDEYYQYTFARVPGLPEELRVVVLAPLVRADRALRGALELGENVLGHQFVGFHGLFPIRPVVGHDEEGPEAAALFLEPMD